MLPAAHPLLVGVLAPRRARRDLAVFRKSPPDAVEYRADLQNTISPSRVAKALQSLRATCPHPLIFTLRDTSEGGEFDQGDELRQALYHAAIPHVAAIDIEIAHRALLKSLHPLLATHKTTIITSFHDFSETPSARALDSLIRAGFASGAHIVKLACYSASPHDALRLLAVPLRFPRLRIAIVGMGPLGRAVRLVAPAFGSVLGYAAASAAVAPGQLSIDELRTAWSLLGFACSLPR
ncbi:MAG: type I 3-dehydroquinate dehydratase [bacterium]|nr:type I 3-dehydroquinate dehydratase [bacterium]